MTERTQVSTGLMILSILLIGVAGCATVGTQPVDPTTSAPPEAATQSVDPTAAPPTVEATLPAGWETYMSQGQCGYTLSHPADMEGASQNEYSWILSSTTTDPNGPFPNFVFVSVIPDGFQNEPGAIYNYDPGVTENLLKMQVGESKSLHENPDLASSFTYTRLPDTALSNQAVQMYENTQPWEFPPGTKEVRYYLRANGCIYLIGGYMDATGAGQAGAMNEELFDQIIATFRLAP
jgi:hypothetical protein